MQAQPQNPGDVKALVLLQIELVFMHRLLKNQKTLFTSGTLKIAKLQNNKAQPVYFININSFYYGIHPDTYFIKVPYQDTVAYVFPHFDNGLSAISVLAHCPQIQELDRLLGQAGKLVTVRQAFQVGRLRDLILENYPILQKEQIHFPDSIKKVITTAGTFIGQAFTRVGNFVKGGVEKAGNYLNDKITEGEPRHVEEATKEKWQKFKEGTNNFIHVSADFAGKLVQPVVTKAKEYSNQLGDKIDRSQNGTVKYAKELVQVSGQAIGQAFGGLVKGSTEIVSEIGSQGKKMITKKYGQEVVDTFAGEKKKEEHQVQNKEVRGQNVEGVAEESNIRLIDHRVGLDEHSEQKIQYPSLDK